MQFANGDGELAKFPLAAGASSTHWRPAPRFPRFELAKSACRLLWLATVFGTSQPTAVSPSDAKEPMADTIQAIERQITHRPCGHILTNTSVWSPDGRWLVYDTRSDPAGENFDGGTIEIVNSETHHVRELYHSQNGAHCGVATFSPRDNRVVFILGPEHPTADWQYNAWHRHGVVVDIDRPSIAVPLDARDLTPPFTPGALRGGTHVHVFDGGGEWVSFTYEDHVLAALDAARSPVPHDSNQRNVGISLPQSVRVPRNHPRNHDGSMFSTLVTRTVNAPRPGSDEISKAFEDAWVGTNGYVRPDGSRQRRAIAFQGHVVTHQGVTISEVFVVDIPDDPTHAGDAPLAGTPTTRPTPPRGTQQRRVTFTADRKFPGLQGPRHWLRSSPDGSRIAFLMRDDTGVVQLWTISPGGGEPHQLTHNKFNIQSAFTWSADGKFIAHIADNSVFVTDSSSGHSHRLTPRVDQSTAPRPEACVFSPSGKHIAYVRPVTSDNHAFNQIFIATLQ